MNTPPDDQRMVGDQFRVDVSPDGWKLILEIKTTDGRVLSLAMKAADAATIVRVFADAAERAQRLRGESPNAMPALYADSPHFEIANIRAHAGEATMMVDLFLDPPLHVRLHVPPEPARGLSEALFAWAESQSSQPRH